MKMLVGAWMLALAAMQTAAVDKVTFDLSPAGFVHSGWGFEVRGDGQGRFYEKTEPTPIHPDGVEWKDVTVSAATLEVLQAGVAGVAADKPCETKTKNISQTGKKKLGYWHGETASQCEFNYSDDEGVMKATGAFQAMAQTMHIGARLKHKHRFDHLGLDAELDALIEQSKDGRAIEIQNIAPVLQSILDDEELMTPSRRKAQTLLAMKAQATVKAR